MRILFFILLSTFLWCDVTSADEKFTKNSKVSEKGLKNICGDYINTHLSYGNRINSNVLAIPKKGYYRDYY